MSRFLSAFGLALLASSMTGHAATIKSREDAFVPNKLPEYATPDQTYFKPAMDYDGDGCFASVAVDKDGNTASGLEKGPGGNGCRNDIDNVNAYVRTRCNHGWCAHMYSYYFQKDLDHRHDWETVVVWTQGKDIKFVAASYHDSFQLRRPDDIAFDQQPRAIHPKIIYHREGPTSHVFRFARKDEQPEATPDGRWVYADTLDWHTGYPSVQVRTNMVDKVRSGDGVSIKIADENFVKKLDQARRFLPPIETQPEEDWAPGFVPEEEDPPKNYTDA